MRPLIYRKELQLNLSSFFIPTLDLKQVNVQSQGIAGVVGVWSTRADCVSMNALINILGLCPFIVYLERIRYMEKVAIC